MSEDLRLRQLIISDMKGAISFYQDLSEEEMLIIKTFTTAVQSVINLLRPQSSQSPSINTKEKFDFSFETFMLAEGAIARADSKTMQKIEFWKDVLFYVLGLMYEDIELIYLILLKYAQNFDKGYKEHRRATINRTDAILAIFQKIVQESKHSFMQLKHEVNTEFAAELADFKKKKKEGRRDKI
jgi:hypothetical protein